MSEGCDCIGDLVAPFLPSSTPEPADMEPLPPAEFMCPISGFLMEDPVIIPTGDTFDRACIKACGELDYTPRVISLPCASIRMLSSSLVPNLSLKYAISGWCHRVCHRSPYPVSREDARCFFQRLKEGGDQEPPPETSPGVSSAKSRTKDEVFYNVKMDKVSASNVRHVICGMFTNDGNSFLVWALSTVPANRLGLAGYGAIPALLHALANGVQARDRRCAIKALANLAEEERVRMAMGTLGAVPPLLAAFCHSASDGFCMVHEIRTRAAALLCNLVLSPTNLRTLANMRTIPRLLEISTGRRSSSAVELRTWAIRLVHALALENVSCDDLLSGGAVDLLICFVSEGVETDRYYLGALHRICTNSPARFRELALPAGARENLETWPRATWGDDGVQMAEEMLNVIRGDGDDVVGAP